MDYLLRGILIGLLFGLPVGAVGTMTVQHTWNSGITNPAAILTFLFAFSYFGITAGAGLLPGIMLVSGVFIGTYIWWGTLTTITNILKKKTRKFSFRYMNLIFGTALCLFGAVVLLRLIFK